tara:strand:+ start:132 stop:329 length:198 start_codon:yes stop_codon:yes gene_type:complete
MMIRFLFETKYGNYSDALHLADDHTFTEAEIEAMKQERLDNWIAMIEAPKEPVAEIPSEVPTESI